MTDTPTTINLYGIEPAGMPQEHADLVAQTLGLRGAERWDCGHDYGWWMPQGKLIVTRLRQDAKHANVRCVTTSELVELLFTEGARLRAEVEALAELYDSASVGFTTMRSSGHDGEYTHVSKFPSLDALQRYGAAWANAMVKARDARKAAAIDAARTPEGAGHRGEFPLPESADNKLRIDGIRPWSEK